MKKAIKCIVSHTGEFVTAIASDRDKFIKLVDKDGNFFFEKACVIVAPHIREYNIRFSRKLLDKLPYDKDFWTADTNWRYT